MKHAFAPSHRELCRCKQKRRVVCTHQPNPTHSSMDSSWDSCRRYLMVREDRCELRVCSYDLRVQRTGVCHLKAVRYWKGKGFLTNPPVDGPITNYFRTNHRPSHGSSVFTSSCRNRRPRAFTPHHSDLAFNHARN